ncbi:hypothetical protein BDZ45DRAFT_734997 [Acephala macrosclerotiorum]|nr:hypothetical protein BDZ45DRAFT_734997 [Acephala macrosclerotiorum]
MSTVSNTGASTDIRKANRNEEVAVTKGTVQTRPRLSHFMMKDTRAEEATVPWAWNGLVGGRVEDPAKITSLVAWKLRKARHIHYYANHPDRDPEDNWELRVYPSKGCQEGYGEFKYGDVDWLCLEWIRKASNVSTQFRKELGNSFWTRTAISYEASWSIELDETCEKALPATGFEHFRAARKLRVTQKFTISVTLMFVSGHRPMASPQELALSTTLSELMMPDTLRHKPAETEMDAYTQ